MHLPPPKDLCFLKFHQWLRFIQVIRLPLKELWLCYWHGSWLSSQYRILFQRQGRCQIEADAVAVDIMNRKELEVNAGETVRASSCLCLGVNRISTRIMKFNFIYYASFILFIAGDNPGLAALWEDEKARRRNNEESSFLQSQFSNDSSRLKGTTTFYRTWCSLVLHRVFENDQFSFHPAEFFRSRKIQVQLGPLLPFQVERQVWGCHPNAIVER